MISVLELLFLGTAFLSVLTGAGILMINPNRTINRIFVLVSMTIAVWFFCIFIAVRGARLVPETQDHVFWLRVGSVATATLPWFMHLMIMALARPTRSLQTILRQSWPWMVIAGALMVLVFSESFIPSDSLTSGPKRGPGYTLYAWVLLIQNIALLSNGYHHMRRLTGAQRIEMKLFVLTTGLACLLALLASYFGRMLQLPLLSRSAPFIFFLLWGLTIWTVTYHRIFDARQVMASIGQRIILLGILGLGAIGLFRLVNPFVDRPNDVLIPAVGAGVLALVCERPTRRWFGLDHEHRLMASREAIVTWARQVSETEKLKLLFEEFLCDWCQADRVVLLSSNSHVLGNAVFNLTPGWAGFTPLSQEGWITPELLQRRKSGLGTTECIETMSRHHLGALLAVPPGSDSPTLVLALGMKRGLRPYTYPEIRLLLNLAELMDNILTHATLSTHAARLAQMESAAMMSRSLAHDLNNLTTPVATYLLHAQGRAAAGTAEAEVYDAALQSVKVMNDYIQESLFFSRRLVPEFRAVDPVQSLAAVVRLCQERAARREVVLEPLCTLQIPLTADPVLFQRLAVNLVNNAIDASAAGTTVTISIGVRNSGQISLTVSDQGSGIPPEHLPRIFDPYFTTKDTGDTLRGLGLGLAICRKIADLHGGQIEVNSIPGRGATFTTFFPQNGLSKPPARDLPGAALMTASLLGRLGAKPAPQ